MSHIQELHTTTYNEYITALRALLDHLEPKADLDQVVLDLKQIETEYRAKRNVIYAKCEMLGHNMQPATQEIYNSERMRAVFTVTQCEYCHFTKFDEK